MAVEMPQALPAGMSSKDEEWSRVAEEQITLRHAGREDG